MAEARRVRPQADPVARQSQLADLAGAVEQELVALSNRLAVNEAALSAVIEDLQYGPGDEEDVWEDEGGATLPDFDEELEGYIEANEDEDGEVEAEDPQEAADELAREAAAREAREIHDGSTHDRSIERQARMAARAAEGIDPDGPRAFIAGVGGTPAPGEEILAPDYRVSAGDATEGRQLQAPVYPEGEDGSRD